MLSNDNCRCHDERCPKHESCERFIHRHDKGDWISHCMSLRDGDDVCKLYWPAEDDDEIHTGN